jgi:hypothetical protein
VLEKEKDNQALPLLWSEVPLVVVENRMTVRPATRLADRAESDRPLLTVKTQQ